MARSILSRAARNGLAMVRGSEFGDSSIPSNGSLGAFGAASAGSRLDGALALSVVYSCVKVIHDDFRALPFLSYVGDPRGARRVQRPQPRIVAEPFGPDMDPSAGIAQLEVSETLRGAWYCYVVNRDPVTDLPDQLLILHPDKVKARWATGKDADARRGVTPGQKVFEVRMGDSNTTQLMTTREIVQGNGFTLPGAPAGVDVITAQRLTFDAAMDVIDYGRAAYQQGINPNGVVKVPGKLNRTQIREYRDQVTSSMQGTSNVPLFLTGGAEWQTISVTPENAQFLEVRGFDRETICGLFGVPLQRIQAIVENASQGGGKGVDALDRGYVTHTLLPKAKGVGFRWDRMVPGGDPGDAEQTFTGFDWDTLLEPAAFERAQIAQIYRMASIRTPNQIRGSEGWEPDDDPRADDLFVPTNSNMGGADSGAAGAAPATIAPGASTDDGSQ